MYHTCGNRRHSKTSVFAYAKAQHYDHRVRDRTQCTTICATKSMFRRYRRARCYSLVAQRDHGAAIQHMRHKKYVKTTLPTRTDDGLYLDRNQHLQQVAQ